MTSVEAPRETRYHQLVVLAPDGIMIHDGERVLLANNAAARLAGATQLDQLIGAPIEGFLKPPFLKSVEGQLLAAGDLGAVVTPIRDTFHRLDGTTIEVDVTAIAFMDGRRTSVHLVIRDVTSRLAVEDASRLLDLHLQQAQRMEAVGALAGGVAHEVNNMMSVVLGFGEFMLHDAELPAARAEDVREIMKAAERAAGVTRQLLAFSRRAFYQPAAFDLGAAVLAAEPALRRLLGVSRGLSIDVAGAPDVWADASQLEQVLVNLALNARDAMGDDGTFSIGAVETEVRGGAWAYGSRDIPPGRYALLTVSDTGNGMDAETQSRLFEPFYTTKAAGHGTGLGLAAVYGILRQNNGYITVESELGTGTPVPAVPPARRRDAHARSARARKHGRPAGATRPDDPAGGGRAGGAGDRGAQSRVRRVPRHPGGRRSRRARGRRTERAAVAGADRSHDARHWRRGARTPPSQAVAGSADPVHVRLLYGGPARPGHCGRRRRDDPETVHARRADRQRGGGTGTGRPGEGGADGVMRSAWLRLLLSALATLGSTAATAQEPAWARLLVNRFEMAYNDRDTVAMASVLAPEVTLHQPGQAERREARAAYARDLRAMLVQLAGARVTTIEELLSPGLIIRRELVSGLPNISPQEQVRIYRVTAAGIVEIWLIPIGDQPPPPPHDGRPHPA